MLIPVLLFIVGLLFLIKGGDWFVDGASALARRFHLPELLIGATVVSIGTTLPEVMVSTMSALSGHGEIAYGNAIGSVICNAALIAAITIAVRPGKVDPKTLKTPVAFFFAAAAIYCIAAYVFGKFTRVMGFIMLAMFVAYMVVNVLQMKKAPAVDAETSEEEEMSLARTLILLVLGAVLIAVGANLLVDAGYLSARAGHSHHLAGQGPQRSVAGQRRRRKRVQPCAGQRRVRLAGTLHHPAELHAVRYQFQPCVGTAGHAGRHADSDRARPRQGQAKPRPGYPVAGHLRRLLCSAVYAVI